tara:strand:+ start:220 stop:426 length:207 start_codon:yes stop_codon:yes gene_type:complete
MTTRTYIEDTIERAFNSLDLMLGVSRRAREGDGTFKADDKSTPEVNEAWKSGKSPKKKATRKKVKKTK